MFYLIIAIIILESRRWINLLCNIKFNIYPAWLLYFMIISYIESLKEKQASTEQQAALLSQENEQLNEDLEVSTPSIPSPFRPLGSESWCICQVTSLRFAIKT